LRLGVFFNINLVLWYRHIGEDMPTSLTTNIEALGSP